MKIARAALSIVAALGAACGTAIAGLYVTEGGGGSRSDLLGVLSLMLAAGALLLVVAHLPLLALVERRQGSLTMARAVTLSAVVANLPAYAALGSGQVGGGAFGRGEAALFGAAFAVLGVVFAVVFTTLGRRPTPGI